MNTNNGEGGWEEFCTVAREALSVVLEEQLGSLHPDEHLLDDLGLDSFGVLVFVGELEMRLGVVIPTSDDEPTLAHFYQVMTGAPA